MELILFIICSLFVGVMTMITYTYFREKRLWNNGICRQTGKEWESFDMDSQGNVGYYSDNNTIWISPKWTRKE